ncbi:MAG: peptidylprolyl isomerase [Defluviitaleaceae bacterium]|nr:peptidylprolyl isomerase [Defluviitaleaceae bacterium]
MHSLLKYASIFNFAIITIVLMGCGGQSDFDVTVADGDNIFIETDLFQLTNQEAFERVAGGYVNWMNPGVATVLDWVDTIILADVAIDESAFNEQIEFMENVLDEDALHDMMLTDGFDALDDYFASIRLEMLREQAVLDSIDISEAAIDEVYERVFAANEDDDETEDDDDAPTPEEIREMIAESLKADYLSSPGFSQEVLAQLRQEAGFIIHSRYFAAHYDNFLASWLIDTQVETGDDSALIATVSGYTLTADQLFDSVMRRFAFNERGPLFNFINLNVLQDIYAVDHDIIRHNVSQAKLNMLHMFYPQMEAQGLLTEQQIFDFFFLSHLQELALNEHVGDISDERLQTLYEAHVEALTEAFEHDSTPNRSARHILIQENDDLSEDDARALAEDIIAQLQAVAAEDVEDLFMELAMEHGTDGTAAVGGDLGSFGPGAMVLEFEEAVFALEVNTFTTEPVETQFGFHVIYLYDIEEIDEPGTLEIPTLEEVRSTLIENERHRLFTDARYLSNVMFNLRATQNIRFHDEQQQARYDALREQNIRSIEQ